MGALEESVAVAADESDEIDVESVADAATPASVGAATSVEAVSVG